MTMPSESAAPQPQAAPAKPEPRPYQPPPHDSALLTVLNETERYKRALDPTTDAEAWTMACRLYKIPGFCGLRSIEDAYTRILLGRVLGLPAAIAIQAIDMIPSRTVDGDRLTPSLRSKAKVAICLSRRDVIEYVREVEITNERCTWEIKRVGGQPQRETFTMDDARVAGLVGRGDKATKEGVSMNNYDRHPKPMLRARASGRLCDREAADLMHGMATAEEVEDDSRIDDLIEKVDGPATPPPPPPQANARDFTVEAAILKDRIAVAGNGTPDQKKQVRADVAKFVKEAPSAEADDVKRFYGVILGSQAAANGAQPTANTNGGAADRSADSLFGPQGAR